jgi:signal transduction histidine kinase
MRQAGTSKSLPQAKLEMRRGRTENGPGDIQRLMAELETVLALLPHGVYVASADAQLRMNEQARTMCGETFPSGFQTLRLALAGETSTEIHKSSEGWIQSKAQPVIVDGRIIGAVAINTDVTQQHLQDEALRRSEKLASLGQLVSSIAHEINNPLESITNLLYLVRHASSLSDAQEYADLAQKELVRVAEIALQTLRFHRQRHKPGLIDLDDLLHTVMTLYTGRLLVLGIGAEVRVLPTPPVFCLDGEIRQVINNLVRNALDAMEGRGGQLRVRLRAQYDLRTMQEGVRLTVADTGNGIRPEVASHLFEPFYTTKEHTGTGLGLWVCKGIIERHGGYIHARSRVNRGTVFSVWLPLTGREISLAEAY